MSGRFNKLLSIDLQSYIRKWNLSAATEALVIANTTLLTGLFLYQLVNPSYYGIPFFQVDLDLSLIGVIFIWASLIFNPIGLALLVVGWIFAGVYTKRKYGDVSTGILLKGSSIPVSIALISIGIILLSLLFSFGGGALVVLEFFLIFAVLYIFSAIFVFPGIIITQFVSFTSSYDYTLSVETDYLVLDVVPDTEKVSHCPFRSDNPGCSYLGYTAPNQPLICDYESTYLRCRVYSHIYEQYVGDQS